MTDPKSDDPVLAGLERIHAHGVQTVRRIDELAEVLNRLFQCLHELSDRIDRIEADHARLMAERPMLPMPPRPH
jgi:hypothetical protein